MRGSLCKIDESAHLDDFVVALCTNAFGAVNACVETVMAQIIARNLKGVMVAPVSGGEEGVRRVDLANE